MASTPSSPVHKLLVKGRLREGEGRRLAREARVAVLMELRAGAWLPDRSPRREAGWLENRIAILHELREVGVVEEGFQVRSSGSVNRADGTREVTEVRNHGWALTPLGRQLAAEIIPGSPSYENPGWTPSAVTSFQRLRGLSQEDRRLWLRAWMTRVGLASAGAAAEVLCVSRQSVERMVYPGSKERISITDATLRIAYLTERVAPDWD